MLRTISVAAFISCIIGRVAFGVGPLEFISAPHRVDMVTDSQNVLYISSTDGNLLRYNLTSQSFLSPIVLGGTPYGVDISPDGNNIVVADLYVPYPQRTNSCVHVVNLPTGATSQINFSLESSQEGGTCSVAFADNNTFLAASGGATWNPLHKVNLAGSSTNIDEVPYWTDLSSSADHSVIGIAEQYIMPQGPGRYMVSDGNISFGPALARSGEVTAIAASRNGQQYLVTYGIFAYVCDQNLNVIKQLQGRYSDEYALGVVYSPTNDSCFVAWGNASGNHTEIQMFDTNSLNQIGTIDSAPHIAKPDYDNSYKSGRLRMSSDGSLLFATVNGGVDVYAVPEPSVFVFLIVSIICLIAYTWRRRT
jgi:hypothetical protein